MPAIAPWKQSKLSSLVRADYVTASGADHGRKAYLRCLVYPSICSSFISFAWLLCVEHGRSCAHHQKQQTLRINDYKNTHSSVASPPVPLARRLHANTVPDPSWFEITKGSSFVLACRQPIVDFGLCVQVGDRIPSPRLDPLRYITWSHPPTINTGFFLHGSSPFFLLRFCPTHSQRWRVQNHPVRVCHRHLHPPKNLRLFPTSKLPQFPKSPRLATRKTSRPPHHHSRRRTSLEMYLTEVSKHGSK